MRREPAEPGRESVWDYPRPPRLERTPRRIRVVLAGETIVDTTAAWRVLETSHPPGYYVARADVRPGVLVPTGRGSACEWKGRAEYFSVIVGGVEATGAAWAYPSPTPPFAAIAGHVSFYARAMEACLVDDEIVTPQPGDFYGGWITRDVAGPFKGGPGTGTW